MSSKGTAGPGRILVVEDEEALTTLLRYNLDAEGYDVETVGRGLDGLPVAGHRGLPLAVGPVEISQVKVAGKRAGKSLHHLAEQARIVSPSEHLRVREPGPRDHHRGSRHDHRPAKSWTDLDRIGNEPHESDEESHVRHVRVPVGGALRAHLGGRRFPRRICPACRTLVSKSWNAASFI
jgi:hypothetical protein